MAKWIPGDPPNLGELLERSILAHEPLARQPGSALHAFVHSKSFAELKARLTRRFRLLRRYLRACSGAMRTRPPRQNSEGEWARFYSSKKRGEQCHRAPACAK